MKCRWKLAKFAENSEIPSVANISHLLREISLKVRLALQNFGIQFRSTAKDKAFKAEFDLDSLSAFHDLIWTEFHMHVQFPGQIIYQKSYFGSPKT